jgi:hypothetical protein
MSLTNEDKEWIAALFSRQLTNFASNFATKEDLANFATKEDLANFATKEDLERMETKLLTAFHQWASPLEVRVRAHSMAIGAFDGEKENSIEQAKKLIELERRISKLEKAS